MERGRALVCFYEPSICRLGLFLGCPLPVLVQSCDLFFHALGSLFPGLVLGKGDPVSGADLWGAPPYRYSRFYGASDVWSPDDAALYPVFKAG